MVAGGFHGCPMGLHSSSPHAPNRQQGTWSVTLFTFRQGPGPSALGAARRVRSHEVHQTRLHRSRRLAHLPGMHELRRSRAWEPRLDAWARRRAGRSSSGRSTRASTSSTPPTATPTAPAKRSWAAPWATSPAAKRWCIATKVFFRIATRPQWHRGCPASRSCTRSTPACAGWAPTTSTSTRSTASTRARPVEETMEALHDVVKAGKARYIGASSMWAWQFAKLQHTAERHGWTKFVTMQNHYNLLYREEEREMLPLCLDHGRRASSRGARWPAASSPAISTPAPPGGRPTSTARACTRRPTSRSSSGWRGSPPSAACRGHRSAWRGWLATRRSPRPSWASPSRTTSTTPSPRSTLHLTDEEARLSGGALHPAAGAAHLSLPITTGLSRAPSRVGFWA